MKWCFTLGFIFAALGAATEEASNDPPSVEGMDPSQIEKIMIQELLEKPKGSKKQAFSFTKTVKPILAKFKKQMLADKAKMQKSLNRDLAVIKNCIKKMQKSVRLGLLETEDESAEQSADGKKKKCPSDKVVKKCINKMKKLKPKQKACKTLEKISKKDLNSILELIKKWNRQKVLKKDCKLDRGETKYHYVDRLANHFTIKLKKFEKQIALALKKQKNGKKLKKGCDLIKHYQRRLKVVVCNRIKVANYNCKCTKVIKEKKICNIFNGCYAAAVRAKVNNEKEIKKKNAAAKLEWRAIGRIECLLKVMSGKGSKKTSKQLMKCVKGNQISTRPLDLKYHRVPGKPKCHLRGVNNKMRKLCKKGQKKR